MADQQGCEHGPWIPAALCGAVLYEGEDITRVACPAGPHQAPVEDGAIAEHNYHGSGPGHEPCPWVGIRVVDNRTAPAAMLVVRR